MSSLPGPLCPSGLLPKGLSTSLLNRPKTALQKSRAAVLLSSFLISPISKTLSFHHHCVQMASAVTSPLPTRALSVHKQQVQQGSFPGCLTFQLCQAVLFHTLRNLIDSFLSTVLYLQQTSGKLKSHTRTRTGDCGDFSIFQNVLSASSSWLVSLRWTMFLRQSLTINLCIQPYHWHH